MFGADSSLDTYFRLFLDLPNPLVSVVGPEELRTRFATAISEYFSAESFSYSGPAAFPHPKHLSGPEAVDAGVAGDPLDSAVVFKTAGPFTLRMSGNV
ncbi:hypothetical protein KIPB_013360, partial [Kipferlia bialata]|eukprot:g13360.t1